MNFSEKYTGSEPGIMPRIQYPGSGDSTTFALRRASRERARCYQLLQLCAAAGTSRSGRRARVAPTWPAALALLLGRDCCSVRGA